MIIAVTNHKGGTGKTTTAVNVAAGLTQRGARALLIDLDPQNNIAVSLAIDAGETQTIYAGFKSGKLPPAIKHGSNIDVIPGALDLASLEMEMIGEAGREYITKELITPARAVYDYIILDCPPSLGLLTINALTAADIALIPVQTEYLAVKGVTKITEIISKIKKRLNPSISAYIVLTRYSQNKILNRNVKEAIEGAYSGSVLGVIRENIAVAEASAAGNPVISYAPKSAGALDYTELTAKIMELKQ